ncbi:beta-ketoacyl synthase N-terminal-like domain-containing protein [Streptomyces sp. NPDC088348]|uniref:beta-ketoacyl synthase N-terminal-like domain-containing protein n=1 Tax=Streptomyces sp. NPDC088348 TaxID=3365853 RepID=UPI0038189FD0
MNSEQTAQATVVVTGAGLAVPGLAGPGDLLHATGGDGGFDPETGLRGRDLRHKDRATRLALRSVESALRDAGLYGADGPALDGTRTAVVVSSNTGNYDSVCGYVDTAARQTSRAISAMGLPHTSTSAIAGWIASNFGLRGPAVTLCNGATSGLDAVHWGRNLIAADRADTVVVTGVEPHNDVVQKLLGTRAVDGAATVVLESAAHDAERADRARAVLGVHGRGRDHHEVLCVAVGSRPEDIGLWLTGDRETDPAQRVTVGRHVALQDTLGECGGALGVLQCAAAVAHFDAGGDGPVLATARTAELSLALTLLPPPGAPRLSSSERKEQNVSHNTADSVDLEELRSLMAATFELAPEDVTDDASFTQDLGVDSLTTLEIATRLEDRYGVDVTDEEFKSISTLLSVRELVRRKLAEA